MRKVYHLSKNCYRGGFRPSHKEELLLRAALLRAMSAADSWQEWKRAVDINTQRSRTEVFIHDKSSSEESLASKVSNKKMTPVLIKIGKGGKTREETSPGIEKFIYVLDGKIEANVGEERYTLGKGDTLYFEASTPYFFKNTHSHDTKLLCVTSPPTL